MANSKISAGQLEKQAFEVLLSSLQRDVDTYAVWKAKCLDRDSAHGDLDPAHESRHLPS